MKSMTKLSSVDSKELILINLKSMARYGALLNMGFVFYDYQYAQSDEKTLLYCLAIRSVVSFIALIYSAMTKIDTPRPVLFITLGALVIQLFVSGATIVLGLLHAFDSAYFIGVGIVMAGVAILMPWRAQWTLVHVMAMLLNYLVIKQIFIYQAPPEVTPVVSNDHFLVLLALMCVTSPFVAQLNHVSLMRLQDRNTDGAANSMPKDPALQKVGPAYGIGIASILLAIFIDIISDKLEGPFDKAVGAIWRALQGIYAALF